MKKRLYFLFLILLLAVLAGCARIAFLSRTPSDTARIDYPEEQGRLYGKVQIAGVAQAKNEFNSYILEVQKQPEGQWQTIAQGNTPVPAPGVNLERDILGVWETGGFKGGEYKIRLTVYAEGTSQSVIKEHIFLGNCTYVTGISVNPIKFNPYAGEITSIAYTLAAQSEVTIKFYNPYKETVDSCNLGVQSAGPHTFVWKGYGPGSGVVNDTVYTFSVKVHPSSDRSTQIYYPSDGLVDVTPTDTSVSSFNPQRNEQMDIHYTIDRPSWVRIGLGTPELMWAILHFRPGSYIPKLAGSHTDYWDGRKSFVGENTPALVLEPQVQAVIWAHTLPDNFIITEGRAPQISELSANPMIIDLTKGQGTDISYTLSRDMHVTIKIYDGTWPDLKLVRTLIDRRERSAGSHTEHWDGLADNGFPGAPPSPYTFAIEGTSDSGHIEAQPALGAIVIKGH